MGERMRLGFTASRKGFHNVQHGVVCNEIAALPLDEFHHGDCDGGDAQGHDIVRRLHPKAVIHGHPPSNPVLRAYRPVDVSHAPKDYIARDHDIVDQTDGLIAAPDGPERIKSGTWATIRYAIKRGKEVRIVMPDGSVDVRSARPSR